MTMQIPFIAVCQLQIPFFQLCCFICDSFSANDSTGTNSSYTVPIRLCDCNGNGDCLFDKVLKTYNETSSNKTDFQIVQCQCQPYRHEG